MRLVCQRTSPMRFAALDVGERRIGVAASDELGLTAQPVGVVERSGTDRDYEAIRDLLDPIAPAKIVVGLPRNMNGSLGPSAERVSAFAARIQEFLKVPVVFWDERLSTAAVEKVLIQADLSRSKRKRVVDKLAAVYILQGFLDSAGRAGRG